jgi:hypothetical protein
MKSAGAQRSDAVTHPVEHQKKSATMVTTAAISFAVVELQNQIDRFGQWLIAKTEPE